MPFQGKIMNQTWEKKKEQKFENNRKEKCNKDPLWKRISEKKNTLMKKERMLVN